MGYQNRRLSKSETRFRQLRHLGSKEGRLAPQWDNRYLRSGREEFVQSVRQSPSRP